MIIRVSQDRSVVKVDDVYGTQNENRITEITFDFPEQYANFNKKIVFITSDGNYWDMITDNTYIVKNNVTKYRNVSAFVWLTDVQNNIDFRTKMFYIDFNKNENPDNYIPSEEQIDGFDTMMAELREAIEEVEGLDVMQHEIVQTLPISNIDPDTIYFVPKSTPETNNAYDKWIYINDAWEVFGGSNVDLTDYVKNTDYATDNVGGVVKTGYGLQLSNGNTSAQTFTYQQYSSVGNSTFIGKGTLENVLTARIGDINTMLDTINGEVI